jgi:hypothetical protein
MHVPSYLYHTSHHIQKSRRVSGLVLVLPGIFGGAGWVGVRINLTYIPLYKGMNNDTLAYYLP